MSHPVFVAFSELLQDGGQRLKFLILKTLYSARVRQGYFYSFTASRGGIFSIAPCTLSNILYNRNLPSNLQSQVSSFNQKTREGVTTKANFKTYLNMVFSARLQCFLKWNLDMYFNRIPNEIKSIFHFKKITNKIRTYMRLTCSFC